MGVLDCGEPHCIVKNNVIVLIWLSVEVFLFAGITFGWAALVFVLKDEGLHEELCWGTETDQSNVSTTTNPLEHADCVARDDRFNLYFAIATFVATASVNISGRVFAKFGTRTTRLGVTLFLGVACILIAATNKDVPWLVCPGLSLMLAAGLTHLVTVLQVRNMFKSMGGFAVGVLNGMFDSSAAVMLIVKLLYQAGLKRSYIFYGFTVASLSTLFSTFFILPKTYIYRTNERDQTPKNSMAEAVESKDYGEQTGVLMLMKSPLYISHALWFIVNCLRMLLFFGTINRVIADKTGGSGDKVSHYTDALMYTMLGSIVASALAGKAVALLNTWYIKELGPCRKAYLMANIVPLSVSSLLSCLMSGLLMVVQPESLYAVFITATVQKSFVFTANSNFLLDLFPVEHYGTLFGCLVTSGYTVALSQYGFFKWSESYPGAFNHVNGLMLVLGTMTLLHPLFLWRRSKTTSDQREQMMQYQKTSTLL